MAAAEVETTRAAAEAEAYAQWQGLADATVAALTAASTERARPPQDHAETFLGSSCPLAPALREALREAARVTYAFAAAKPAGGLHAGRVAEAAVSLAAVVATRAPAGSAIEDALDAEDKSVWRQLAWACALAGQPRLDVFGLPPVVAAASVAAAVWRALEGCAYGERYCAIPLAREPFPLVWLPKWFTSEEVARLLKAADAAGLWEPSPLALSVGGSTPPRTSESAFLTTDRLDPLTVEAVAAAQMRAAELVGLPTEHVETPQLVRYSIGQCYQAHLDWGNVGDPSLWVAGQRVATVLAYLNDTPEGYTGGCTRFPQLHVSTGGSDGLRVSPAKGAAVAWPNVSASGVPLFETEHEAEPLIASAQALGQGTSAAAARPLKVAMNMWIRDRPMLWT